MHARAHIPTAAPYHGLHDRILESSHFIGEVAHVGRSHLASSIENPHYIYKQKPLHISEKPMTKLKSSVERITLPDDTPNWKGQRQESPWT